MEVKPFSHPFRGSNHFRIPTPPSLRKERVAQTGLELCLPFGPLNGFIGAVDPPRPTIRQKAGGPLRGGWPPNRGAKHTSEFQLDCESNFGIQV
jgi:hypothetical protein